MKKAIHGVLAFLLAGALPLGARAQESGGLKVTTAVKRQVEAVNEKGEKVVSLQDVKNALPGEELFVILAYENLGGEPARNVALTNPIPPEMTYVAGSAEGDGTSITFSVDGGASFDVPENLFVLDEKGERRPAGPGEYTHVRWARPGSLDPGVKAEVRFRAVIR